MNNGKNQNFPQSLFIPRYDPNKEECKIFELHPNNTLSNFKRQTSEKRSSQWKKKKY